MWRCVRRLTNSYPADRRGRRVLRYRARDCSLRDSAYSVCVAPTAGQALELLASAESSICAVVTDLNLPSMDGFELIERIRSDSRTARLPIVVVTGDSDPRTLGRISRLGADAYFGKPYSPAQVRKKVEQLLAAHLSSHSL
jgi:two-component system cell cycle response regulator